MEGLNLIQKRNSKNMCSFCGEKEGVVEYTDSETLQEFRICNTCDWLVCYTEVYGNQDNFEYGLNEAKVEEILLEEARERDYQRKEEKEE